MKITDILKKAAPYLLAILLFLAVALIYCSSELGGKVLLASDKVAGLNAAQESVEFHKQTGDYTWWTGSMFSGMPNYQIGGGHYKADSLLQPLTLLRYGNGSAGWIIFFYLICFFAMFLCFGMNVWLAAGAALATGLSSYFLIIIGAGHIYKTAAIAAMAAVIGGFYLIYRKKYAAGAVLTMIFVALGFPYHPQMFYYFFLMIGLLWIAELVMHIREKKVKDMLVSTCVFVLAVGIGIGANSANLFSNAEYSEQTMRGGQSDLVKEDGASQADSKGLDLEYATQWSYGIGETMSLMIPGVQGGSSHYDVGRNSKLYQELVSNGVQPRAAADFCASVPMYWGGQPFTAGNVYAGAIVCFLFLLGLIVVKGPYKWALLASTLFSIALAWGSNFMPLTEFFFKYFPLYDKFRAVSSILVVAEVAMPLLGFLAVKAVLDGSVPKDRALKGIYISAGVTGGICLLLALLGGAMFSFTAAADASWSSSLPDWLYEAIIDQRRSLLRADSLRSALFIAAAALLLFLHLKGKLKNATVVIAALAALVVLDMWPVDKRFFNDKNFVSPSKRAEQVRMEPYEEAILSDPDPHFRVYNLTVSPFNDARTSYYLKSIGGYSAVKLRRYQDLIDEHLGKMHMPVISMLNTKYFIVSGEDGSPEVQRNPYALGNAWWVEQLVSVDNANAESDALMQVDLAKTAVLDKEFASFVSDFNPGVAEDATVRLTKYTPKTLDYVCSSSQPGTIVFSEIYYPYGWKATIDGKPADHYRVDYMLRAMNVPAGEHEIHFVFDPDSVKKGDTLSVICCLLMYGITLAVVVLAIVAALRGKKKEQDQDTI
ncbi:MAG: hypothetical protein IJU27_05690 [Bacteroidales bacterium]|nr:hypothetical protein [Bacteroidales bacterium]